MSSFQSAVSCALLGFIAASLQGCGGGGGPPSPSPPPPAPPAQIAPDPASWTYVIPDHSNFHCIKRSTAPSSPSAQGFFMYRWATQKEASSQKVNSDDLGDINPYYLLTELMTNTGTHCLASKQGQCTIPKCGEDPAAGGCVLERVYIEMNHEAVKDVLIGGSIWGQYLAVDNGIPSEYAYWAFNWTNSTTSCSQTSFTSDCNFYFNGGYPVGCQAKSDIMDTPVWYSTVAACPQYPFKITNPPFPPKVSKDFQWHEKMNMNDPAVQTCYREMPGGSYCGGLDKQGHPKGTPWTTPSPTCTWTAKNAGYLTVEDIFNIKQPQTYHDWCMAQPDKITGYGDASAGITGIPWNITLFYNLSEHAFPDLQAVNTIMWHSAASSDENQLTQAQKKIFQNWAKWAKVRLNEMFSEMDKQAFAEFNKHNITDPDNQTYEGCLSNQDVTTPVCKNGVSATVQATPTFTV